jgi:beta-N-acetylhexosaminidase
MPYDEREQFMLSLEEKVGQMLMVGFDGLEAPEYLLRWLSNGLVGNVVLFARNVASPTQLAELTQALHDAAAHPLLIAIDQEGGAVARLREGFSESPGAMALGAADSEALAEDVAAALGEEMSALGINWNLAPVVDISQNADNPSIGIRSLGANTERVSSLAVAQVKGFQKAGVAATAKHFPGKGNTPVDPHVDLPVLDTPPERLRERDLVPFQAVIQVGIAAVMVTHAQFAALDPESPSTLSPRIIRGLLRQDIGFNGVVMTDCLEMKAIMNRYQPAEAAQLAARAGADVILFSHTQRFQELARQSLLKDARTGRLPMSQIDTSVARILDVKDRFGFSGKTSVGNIRHPSHLITVQKAARAAIATIRASVDTLPLERDDRRSIGLVEFVPTTDLKGEGRDAASRFIDALHTEAHFVQSVVVSANTPARGRWKTVQLAGSCDLLIVATRNAHLIPLQMKAAQD